MSKICEILGKKVQVGNNVPKSNKKTKRVFLPNLQIMSFKSDILNKTFKIKICTRAAKTIMKYGSIDAYMLVVKANKLTDFARKIRIKIRKKVKVAS
jgi:large subunit ribosomal protein L28